MPWLEERTLTLFVRDTEVRRYEPGVRERGVDVDRPSGPLMGSADTDTDTDPDRALSLKAPVIHGHLIRQHFFSVVLLTYLHLSNGPSEGLSRPPLFTTPRAIHGTQTVTRTGTRYRPESGHSRSRGAFPRRRHRRSTGRARSNPGDSCGGGWTSSAEELCERPVYRRCSGS